MIGSIHHLATLDHEGIEYYRSLRRPAEHRKAGLFIAEGTLVVERFLQSGIEAISVLMTPVFFERYRPFIERRAEAVTVYIAEKKLLETIVGFECHQGVMALGKVPPQPALEDLLVKLPAPRLFVAADGITSAENAGVIVRTSAGCGASALLTGETSADPWLRRSVRNSMGAIFTLPVIYADSLTATLRDLRRNKAFTILAAHPRPESVPLFAADFSRDTCVVFGSEGNGISEPVLSECDATIAIPMAQGVDSLNVACACAAVLYEALRQKIMGKGNKQG
jgi:tRNA G18 (ribose-2'-O)-methylase SpoU